MFENCWTEDTSDQTARFLVRGYFSGDGQHWTRVFDRETGLYTPEFFRDSEMARDKARILVLVHEALAQPSPFAEVHASIDAAFAALEALR